jgi:hypothetical protein
MRFSIRTPVWTRSTSTGSDWECSEPGSCCIGTNVPRYVGRVNGRSGRAGGQGSWAAAPLGFQWSEPARKTRG